LFFQFNALHKRSRLRVLLRFTDNAYNVGVFIRTHDIARIATHEDDSGGLNRYVGSRTYCDSYICSRQCWRVIHSVTYHRDLLAAGLKALHR
jgi:hypothetical protein